MFPPASVTLEAGPNRAVFPFEEEAPKRPGAVKGAPNGAAERTLDGEDRFEMIEKGETSATNPGAESGSIAGKDRGPLQ